MMTTAITALGTYLPQQRVGNAAFERRLDTTADWITSRTGIRERRFSSDDELTSDLAVEAVRDLERNRGTGVGDTDFVIVATSSPDQVIPSTASQVQYKLDLAGAGAVDVSGACAGFTYALMLGQGLVAAGSHRQVLVIGAEAMSRVVDFNDRSTCVLFGDGAGAVLVEPARAGAPSFVAVSGTAGAHGRELYLAANNDRINGDRVLADGRLHQNGRFVFRWVVENVPRRVEELLQRNGLALDQIDWFIPHSANMRMLEAIGDELGLGAGRTLESVRECGNTSTASIPLAWQRGIADGRVKPGDRLVLMGFGGGMTYAGLVVEQAF